MGGRRRGRREKDAERARRDRNLHDRWITREKTDHGTWTILNTESLPFSQSALFLLSFPQSIANAKNTPRDSVELKSN